MLHKRKPRLTYLASVDRLRRIIAVLPSGERNMPIVRLGRVVFTWNQVYREAIRGTAKGKKMVEKLHDEGLL